MIKLNDIISTYNNIYITSDTHYSHRNLCKGVTSWDISTQKGLDAVRDFDTLERMNDTMVNNINSTVEQTDCLIHMGDWSFGGFEKIREFWNRLVCKNIILITGNHDRHIKDNKDNVKELFTHIAKMEEIQIGKDVFIFCHYPVDSWMDMNKGTYMIHGHLHNKGNKRFCDHRKMDVGMCGHPEFRPYHIDEVINLLKNKTYLNAGNK